MGRLYWSFQAYVGTDETTGKRVRVTRRKGEDGRPFRTKKDAQREMKRLVEQFEWRGAHQGTQKNTFRMVYERWLKGYSTSVRESTLANTNRRFKRYILPRFGDVLLDKVDRRLCDDVVNEWQKEDPKDFKRSVGLARQVLDYAVYTNLIRDNPMQNIRIPRLEKQAKRNIEFFEKDELIAFLDFADNYGRGDKWGVFFHLLAYTGCRKSEALALEWSDIDLNGRTVSFSKTLSKISRVGDKNEVVVNHTTKNGETRIVAIDSYTVDRLNEWKKQTKKGLVFPSDGGTYIHPDLVRTTMKRMNKKMNNKKNVTPHGLRHTHCSLLFEAGRSIKEVQTRLGHKSSKVTMDIYAHVTRGKEVETADAFLEHIKR